MNVYFSKNNFHKNLSPTNLKSLAVWGDAVAEFWKIANIL